MTLTITARRLAAIVLALVILFGCYLLGAARDNANAATGASSGPASAAPPGISVSAVGKATGTPDTLRLNLSVSVTGTTVTTALAGANEKARAVQKSLQASGVAPKDLQTSGLNIQPDYSGKNDPPVVTGYQVQESLTAVLRNLKTAGAAITAAAEAGGQATRIDGISLDLEDTGALITSARADAFAQARAKAQQYAGAAGVSLGRVVSIQEAVQPSGPQPLAYPAAAAADQAVPIQAGSQELSVTVTVAFAIT